jgi:putative pyruvate formate lyase activating enzyme
MWRRFRPDAVDVLKDKLAIKSLGRYFAVMQDELPAKFLIAKCLPAEFREEDSDEKLWQEHVSLAQDFRRVEKRIDDGQVSFKDIHCFEKSFLDLKIELARRVVSSCHLCTRRCRVNRLEGVLGYCKCGLSMVVSSIFEHTGEEPELVPSGTVFTLGCTMQCKHCQNWTISQWVEQGEVYEPEGMAREVERLRLEGCRNANLVGGEPTPWLLQWLRTFKLVDVNVPVVWNSNSYYSPETALLLEGFADVFLLDFKYGPGGCAERISSAPKYWEVCTCNHLAAKKHGELIVRVLVLPGHLECCLKPIVRWIAENLGVGTRVNIMFQYRPEWRASEVSELGRRLTVSETDRAAELAREAGLVNFIT